MIVSSNQSWALDPQVQALLTASAGNTALHLIGVDAARARVTGMRALLPPPPLVNSVTDVTVTHDGVAVPVRIYEPTSEKTRGSIVYLHGGGWVLGGIEDSDSLCRILALGSGHELISVGYRLAPEHPFPSAIDDADAVVQWISRTHRPGEPIVVVGDSAGGNLAAVVARRMRDRGSTAVVLQVLIYPVTDPRMASESYLSCGDVGLLIGAADMAWFWNCYVPDTDERSSPDVAPLLAEDLAGLPAAFLLIAEYDVLRDDGIAYARRMANAGVDVTVDRYETMIHGFLPMVGLLNMATTAVDSIASACASALAHGPAIERA